MWRGRLVPLDGHSALGEDIVYPAMARVKVHVRPEAMMNAFAGAGIQPSPIIAAIFGAAAILEIIDPDAPACPPNMAATGQSLPLHLAGQGAVSATGLPEKIHIKGINGRS